MTGRHNSRPIPTRRRLADLALLGVAGAWGATFVMVKDALDAVGPLTLVTLRFGIAALAMLPFVARHALGPARTDSRLRSVIAAGALVGAFLFAGYALQTAGLQFTGAGRAGFITGLNVVIVPLLAATVVRQPVGRAVALGVALATVGLGLLSLGDLGSLSHSDVTPASPGGLASGPFEVNVGDLLVLGCALAFALHILASVVTPRSTTSSP